MPSADLHFVLGELNRNVGQTHPNPYGQTARCHSMNDVVQSVGMQSQCFQWRALIGLQCLESFLCQVQCWILRVVALHQTEVVVVVGCSDVNSAGNRIDGVDAVLSYGCLCVCHIINNYNQPFRCRTLLVRLEHDLSMTCAYWSH